MDKKERYCADCCRELTASQNKLCDFCQDYRLAHSQTPLYTITDRNKSPRPLWQRILLLPISFPASLFFMVCEWMVSVGKKALNIEKAWLKWIHGR
jgi:RNA polymerase subunit RPABC4/transcription elongation factor Spt4